MDIYTPQRKKISLSQKDFVCQGGEAQVYAKGTTAYKLYLDPKKAISKAKFQELSRIKNPSIIKPEEYVLDLKGQILGYQMPFVRHADSICRIFTRAFKERNNLGFDTIQNLVLKIRQGVEDVHRAGVLIVDLNEMNILVDHKFQNIFFIDVDSYQTPSFPATALMPSVRDWKYALGDFTENSDWFSFAIVTFQLFIGIHPYKGKHPKIKGMEERMKAGISVFNPSVTTPQVCYPLTMIPPSYLDWYTAVLEKGERCAPPKDFQGTVIYVPVIQRIPVSGSAIQISEFGKYSEDIRGIQTLPNGLLVWTKNNVYLNQNRICPVPTGVTCFGSSKRQGIPVGARVDHGKLVLTNLYDSKEISTEIEASRVTSYEGRFYIHNQDRISQVILTEMGDNLVPSLRLSSNVLPYATQLFSGVAIQDLLGSTFVSLYPAENRSHQVRVPELDGRKVIEAKLDKNVLMVMTSTKRGAYDRFIFKFDEDFLKYDARKIKNVPLSDLNFVVLDRGICINLTEEEEIEVFSASYGSTKVRVVSDPGIGSDMVLYKNGDAVLFPKGDKVFRLRIS